MTKQLEGLTQDSETILDTCARKHPVGSVASLMCRCTIFASLGRKWTPGPDWPNPHFKWLAPEMYKE